MENKRQTAYKLWIQDITQGEFVKSPGNFEPSYINTRNLQVSRVNIIATAIYKTEDGDFSSLIIEDSSGSIRVKDWSKLNLLQDVNIGDLILIVGKPRQFNNEIYIVPEIARKLNEVEWLKVRELELIKAYGKIIKKETQINTKSLEQVDSLEKSKIQENRQRVLSLIETLNKDDGVEYSEIKNRLKLDDEESQFIIEELLKEGEIYEISEGKLKILN